MAKVVLAEADMGFSVGSEEFDLRLGLRKAKVQTRRSGR
jgi:hypothetical protein